MLWEDNYLAHYGISRMKWGVRRFQNEDGSLTEEGRKRYMSFSKTKSDVQKKMTNNYKPFKRQPFNVYKVMERGDISELKANECCDYANRLFDRAKKIEPTITKDIVSATKDSGGMMYGLENRMKQPTSIAAKIGQTAKEDNISIADASKDIKDVIRYTSIFNDNQFTNGYYRIKAYLEALGYNEIKCKNYFALYRDNLSRHKAVQCIYSGPDGIRFELQFHTPASQAAKELKVPIYEARRKSGLSDERKQELEQQMTDLAEQVRDPKNVFSIQSH